MHEILTGIGVKLHGHLKIYEYKNRSDYNARRVNRVLLNKRNAIHKDNASVMIVNALTNRDFGSVAYMFFGNGGTSIDGSGNVIFLPPHDSGTTADLYSPVFFQLVDDNLGSLPGNQMAVRHISNSLFTDMDIRCLIGVNQPFGQLSSNQIDGINLNTTTFAFDEIGLKSLDGTLITHVIFSPVLKTASSILEVVYTVRLAVGLEHGDIVPVNDTVTLLGVEVQTGLTPPSVGNGDETVTLTGLTSTGTSGFFVGLGVEWEAFHTGFRWREDTTGGSTRYAPGGDEFDNLVMNGNLANVASGVDGTQLFAMNCDQVSDAVDAWFGSPVVIRSGTYIGGSWPVFVPICQGQYILAMYQAGSPHSVSSESYKWFVLLDPVSTASTPVCLGAVAYNVYVTGPPYLGLTAITSSGAHGVNDPLLLVGSNNFGGNDRSLVIIPSPAEITSGVYKISGFNQTYPFGPSYVWAPCEVPFCFYSVIGTADLTYDLYQQNDGGMFTLPGPGGGTNLYFYMNKTYTHFNLYINGLTGATIANPGSGYVINQVLDVVGGVYDVVAQVKINSVDGLGGATSMQVWWGGNYWTVPSGSPLTPTGGSGTGFTFNPTWSFNGSPYVNVEMRDVIAPSYPDGSIVKIALSNSQINFNTVAFNSVNDGTPHNGCIIDGTGVTPMYTVDNANWQKPDTSSILPFDDEWTIISTYASGGRDVYPPIPASTIDNGDGTWTVTHMIWGNSDTTFSGFIRPVAIRKFIYDSSTSVAVQESRVTDRLLTSGEAPWAGSSYGGIVHYEGSDPVVTAYHDFPNLFFGPIGGVPFRSTFGTRSVIQQKSVGGAHFNGTQTVIMNSPSGLPSDNGKGTVSFWYNRGVYSGGSFLMCGEPNDNTPLFMKWFYSHHFQMGFKDPTGTKSILYDTPTTGFIPAVGDFNTWCHFIMSWDMNFLTDPRTSGSNPPQMLFLINRQGRSLNRTISGTTKWKLDYTAATSYRFFTQPVTPQLNEFSLPIGNLQGDIAEFWFAPGVFMDVGDPDILSNWVSPDQGGGVFHPARMGTNGELPLLGITPFVYFSSDPNSASFTNNLGYGGAATLTGTLTDSATNP